MHKLIQLLSGNLVLAQAESKFNGHVRVVRDFAWGTYIQADGLTQSGGVVENIWKTALKPFTVDRSHAYRQAGRFTNILILGLGGGTVAKLLRKKYPNAKITGVDIDPVFIEYGKKYLGLKELKVKTVIDDAMHFMAVHSSPIPCLPAGRTVHYDLIVIDIYQGRSVPSDFVTPDFVKKIKKLLAPDGIAVFNRLYYGEKRPEAVKFLKVLEKVFKQVDPIYPQANVMFFCKN